jgi:chromosome segregation and condensation protein ScpB
MFRLFRRKKKETPEKLIEKKEDKTVSDESKTSEITSEEMTDSIEPVFEVKETPFEEKFGEYAKILPETLLEEDYGLVDHQRMIPLIKNLVDQNDSIFSFISPQIISRHSSTASSISESYLLMQEDLPPASLEERIEGALFAVGRPIHISEIIDNFDEDSPTIKRAIRRLSRRKKRTSALIIEEISKDRWVFQLNPIFHEFFQPIVPDLFLSTSERVVLTEIAYRQPISLALVKKMVMGIGPIKVTEICNKLEESGFVVSEKRSRSLIYTSTPKFAKGFGFDNESRRLKLQMLWRLKRLMGDFEVEEPEELEDIDEEGKIEEEDSELKQEDSSIVNLSTETVTASEEEENADSVINETASDTEESEYSEDEQEDLPVDKLNTDPTEESDTESQLPQDTDTNENGLEEESKNEFQFSELISHSDDLDQGKAIKEIKFSDHIEIIEEE